MRHLINSATGTIPTRDYREQLPKKPKKVNAAEVDRKNAVKQICLDCDRKECSGNCTKIRKGQNAVTRTGSK